MSNEENQTEEPKVEGNVADDFGTSQSAATPETVEPLTEETTPVEGNEPGPAATLPALPAGTAEAPVVAEHLTATGAYGIIDKVLDAIRAEVKAAISDAKKAEHWTHDELQKLIADVTQNYTG